MPVIPKKCDFGAKGGGKPRNHRACGELSSDDLALEHEREPLADADANGDNSHT
jgi:hypothetical protein